MSKDGQGTKCHRKIAENYNARALQIDRRQTDGWATAYSECEHEFTFAKKLSGAGLCRLPWKTVC